MIFLYFPMIFLYFLVFSGGFSLQNLSFTGGKYGEKSQPSYGPGDSFDTISSVGSNTAVVHYKPEKASCKRLSKEEMYLIETGGKQIKFFFLGGDVCKRPF